jgi:hypothetical protein
VQQVTWLYFKDRKYAGLAPTQAEGVLLFYVCQARTISAQTFGKNKKLSK